MGVFCIEYFGSCRKLSPHSANIAFTFDRNSLAAFPSSAGFGFGPGFVFRGVGIIPHNQVISGNTAESLHCPTSHNATVGRTNPQES